MNFPVPCPVISAILGPRVPPSNVATSWPLVERALDDRAIYSPLCAVAAIATISVETRRFRPSKLSDRRDYLEALYENRRDLGNDQPGDGVKFCGRGFIPILGRGSYEYFGREIGVDLLRNPDLAMEPAIAAAILAVQFKDRGVRALADQRNWRMVRLRVAPDGTAWKWFFDVVLKLAGALDFPAQTVGAEPDLVEGLGR